MRLELGGGKVGDMGVDCMGASDVKLEC